MLSNKQNTLSASNVFFQSRHASLQALAGNTQRAAERLTELNVAAAKALATESRAAIQQCLLADGPQALLTLALTQAQANVAKAHSYARHVRDIVFSIRGDEPAEMKIAAHKLSVLADQAAKKLPAVATPALTLSDSANMAAGRALPGPKLAKFEVTDVTEFTEISDLGDPIAGAASPSLADVPGPRNR
jgi:phasin family protein